MKFTNRFRYKSIINTGFDSSVNNSSVRIFNKDGSSNIRKSGISIFEKYSLYHTLINTSSLHFVLITLLWYLSCNLFFASIYYWIGIENLGGNSSGSNAFQDYLDCFFFSTQTLTTVGYGVLHPISNATNIISSIETLFGWMAFAVITGLLYGRFSKPIAYVKFSKNILITPHKGSRALMFRLVPYKNNSLTEAEVQINVAIKLEEDGKEVRKYFRLETEYAKITSLILNWTVVHLLNEESPLYGMELVDFEKGEMEVLVYFKAYDEHFSNQVQARTSYGISDFIDHAKFKQMFKQSDDKRFTLLEIDKLNDYDVLLEI